MKHRHVHWVASASILAASSMLAGCMSSPTYGTGTRADAQLLSDVTGMFSLKPPEQEHIEYKPRAALVTPAPGEKETLPPPQQNIVASSDTQWPESPEERRERLRAEATEARETGKESPIVQDVSINSKPGIVSPARLREPGNFETEKVSSSRPRIFRSNPGITSQARIGMKGNFETSNAADQREEFNKRLAENRQGSPTKRKYLSEPPLVYRQPAATAPTGDVGEDEWKKDRREKRAARKDKSWRDYLPGIPGL
jgi:hypothetical protein